MVWYIYWYDYDGSKGIRMDWNKLDELTTFSKGYSNATISIQIYLDNNENVIRMTHCLFKWV